MHGFCDRAEHGITGVHYGSGKHAILLINPAPIAKVRTNETAHTKNPPSDKSHSHIVTFTATPLRRSDLRLRRLSNQRFPALSLPPRLLREPPFHDRAVGRWHLRHLLLSCAVLCVIIPVHAYRFDVEAWREALLR